MKVFVAGATGALGKQLVPLLVANGHEVVGMTRTEAKGDQLRSVGAQPVVGKSEAACRQLAVRARRHIEEERPRFEASRRDQDELARRFMTAAQAGDMDGLEALLAHDVALHGDGGGKVRSVMHPIFGRRHVAQSVLRFMEVVRAIEGFSTRPVEVNGHPGALGFDGQQRILFALSLDIADGQVQGIRGIVNPDKLRHLGPVSDLMPTSPTRGPF